MITIQCERTSAEQDKLLEIDTEGLVLLRSNGTAFQIVLKHRNLPTADHKSYRAAKTKCFLTKHD